jgi:hypothetical protein
MKIDDLISDGYNIVMGKNKRHIKKNTIIENINAEDMKTYKLRITVENFFAIIQRYPCLINNYERTIKSYRGLLLFVMSIFLAKRINKIIDEKNDILLKIKKELDNEKKGN